MPPLDFLIDRITTDDRILRLVYSIACRHSTLWSEQNQESIDPEMVFRLTLLRLIKRTAHPDAGRLREQLITDSIDPALLYFHLMSVSHSVRKEVEKEKDRDRRKTQRRRERDSN